jgi:hypothetical protein
METPQAPPAPNPAKVAAAQAEANKETAITQYGLAATNQVTPQGSLTYKQVGTWPDGTPRYESTQTYSPEEQSIFETGQGTRQNLANIGQSQSAKIGDLLNTPFNLDASTQTKIAQLQKGFLDPQWQEQGARLEDQLINKGIRPGSEQWDREMRDFSTNRQRAYDQSYLDAYKTMAGTALTERNQPINEITALMSGSQVQQPGWVGTPSPGVAPTDVIGANQMALNQQNVGYNAQVANQNAMMSGLFGLGKTGIGAGAMMYGA